ncbi:MAG TPA: site-2 protease family protein [Acidimicrobiales bacterium]|nr:site-2 protease family protein [Acidimicrobiales bacterium]
MRGSVRVATVAGIPLRVHWSLGLLVVLVLATTPSGGSALAGRAAYVAGLFASVTVHELAHGIVARRRGLVVRDVVLLPIGGVTEVEHLGESARDELRVAIAGPASSLAIGALLAAAAAGAGSALVPPAIFEGAWLPRFAWANLVLGAFNLLPAIPLDGGRILRALLAQKDEERGTVVAARVGEVLAVAMVVAGLLVDLWLVVIGAFVLVGARAERAAAVLRASLHGARVVDLMNLEPAVLDAAATRVEAARALRRAPDGVVFVTEAGRYLGTLTERALERSDAEHAGGAADRDAPVLEATAELYPDAAEALARSRLPALAVVSDGEIVGALRADDLDRLVRRQARAGARR